MIIVTDSALKQLQLLVEGQADPAGKGLRIFVETGGCAGMQYGMAIDHLKEGDEVFEQDGARVFIDAFSAKYLAGSTVDFCDDLTGSGFRIQNPNATRSCGCGSSFETATGSADRSSDSPTAHATAASQGAQSE
jgi:iron-sulfur cluster assembly accessory protein